MFDSIKLIINKQKQYLDYKKKHARNIAKKLKTTRRKGITGLSMRHVNRDGAKNWGTLENWTSTPVTSYTAEDQRETICDRAWDLYVNDAASHGLLETYNVEIAGTGLMPVAMPMTDQLGFDDDWEDEYQQATKDWWEIWGKSPLKFCDASRRMDIDEMMLWAVFSWKLEGIALFQVVWQKESALRPFSLSLLPIAAHRLKTPQDKKSEDNIFDGVEVDSNGAPLYYWIKKDDSDYTGTPDVSDNFYKIPAYNRKVIEGVTVETPNIIACYTVRNISEYRSESSLTSIMKTLRDRHDYKDSALVGSVVANMFTIFLKNGLLTKDPETGEAIRDPVQEVDGGTILSGAPGEEPQVIKTDRPGPHYVDMDHSTIEEIGMSTGRGYEKIIKKWEASYSASRMSNLQSYKFDEADRKILISKFCNVVRSLFLEECALRDYIKVKSMRHFYENMYAYTRAKWLAPPQNDVDPLKAEKADQQAYINKSKNLDDLCAERGLWWKDVLKQRAKELAYMSSLENQYGVSIKTDNNVIDDSQDQDIPDSDKENESNGENNE